MRLISRFLLLICVSCLQVFPVLAEDLIQQAMSVVPDDYENLKDASGQEANAGQGTTNVSVIVPQSTSDMATDKTTDAKEAGDKKKEEKKAAQPKQPTLEPVDQFQRFIEVSTGRRLAAFGSSLFQDAPSTFAPLRDTPVPPDYVIGPGDEIIAKAWGSIELQAKEVVDKNGQISLPKIGVFSVTGVRVSELDAYLTAKVGRLFKNFTLSASVGKVRGVQVYVVGHAQQPGAYMVAGFSTLVNGLFASGGPNTTGSMRNIQLKRAGRIISEIDLYDFIVRGDKSHDLPLQSGDVIVIPPAGPRVAVLGAFDQPAIYEVKHGGETIQQVLAYGGGMPVTASTQMALLERISREQGGRRVVEQISPATDGKLVVMRDGDLLTLLPISSDIRNAVTLRGRVAMPARYPYRPGMRVSDLIPDKDSLITTGYHQRKNALVDYEQGYLTNPGVQVNRMNAASINVGEGLNQVANRLSDEINWDYAVIERMEPKDLSTVLIPFNLGKAILEGDPTQNLPLQPGDVVTVFSKRDMQVPQSRETRLVRLEGEVVSPGVYQVMPGETLRDLILRVGGVTPDAYLYGAEFTRESTRLQQQKSWDENLNRMALEVERNASEQATEALDGSYAGSAAASVASQRKLIENLRKIKPTGRISLEFEPEHAKIADLPNIPLEDGDRFYVPSRPSFVSVQGQVYNTGSFLYRPGKTVSDYLSQAGGATRRAEEGDIYVLHANGMVTSNADSSWLTRAVVSRTLQPGDTIFVPETIDRFSWRKELKDWTAILYQFALGAAALRNLTQ